MSVRRLALIVFAVALVLRLLYLQGALPVLETRQTPVYGDAAGYALTAAMLTHGTPIVPADRGDAKTAEQALAQHMLSTRGPGYILFLTAAYTLFGEENGPVRYLQAGLGALACVFIFLLGRELVDSRAGLVAGLIAALHPSLILFTGRILTETLAIFLFSLGLLALARSLRLRAPSWLCAAGVAVALAALTRPTLLSTIPFIIVGAAIGLRSVPLGRRVMLVAALAVVVATPILAWNRLAERIADDPVAGASGLEIVVEVMKAASAPRFRGWRPDDQGFGATPPGETDAEWVAILKDRPLYPIPAALNLVFYHLWFLDNLWREVPRVLNAPHRGVMILAIGGVGMALVRWRHFAPLLFLLIPMALVSIKWIEIRPNLVFMPVVFVLAGVFVAGAVDLVRMGARPARRLAGLVAAAAATALALYASRLLVLAQLLPSLDPPVLGVLGDATVVAVAMGWGAILAVLARGRFSRREALMVGLVPSLLFVPLYASYCFVVSEPRWRAWEVPLDTTLGPVTQRITLPEPLATARIASARWLVDLRTDFHPPPVRVGVNGVWLTPGQYSWTRLFCRTRRHEACKIYEEGISSFTGALPSSPQWWGVDLAPDLLGRGPSVSLTLERLPGRAEPGDLALGGGFAAGVQGVFQGPSTLATRPGSGSSLTRWHVADDWRMWGEQRLDSGASEGRLSPGAPGANHRSGRLGVLSDMLRRRQAQLNIRLVVEHEGGRRATY